MDATLTSPPSKIIVRLPNWVGDVVMATPILTDLRKAFPKAHITVLCRSSLAELFKHDSRIDQLIPFSKLSLLYRDPAQKALLKTLQMGSYDTGILLTTSFSSAWNFYRAGVKRRIGYRKEGRSALLSDPLSFALDVKITHLVTTYKKLLSPLGIPVSNTKPHLSLSKEEREQAALKLKRKGILAGQKVVGINPGAAFGSAKCWLPERFRELIMRLIQDPQISVVIFGDQSMVSLADSICYNLPSRVINLTGSTTLRELCSLIQCCDVLLTNDSGPMHIAAALNIPLVALFGSTSAIATGPYMSGEVIHKHVACSPCFLRTCPIDFKCMTSIEVDEVFHLLKKPLKRLKMAEVNI
jgi:heptosyltransferase-2